MIIRGRTGRFEFASSLGTVGLSVGATKARTSSVILWHQIFAMLFGRLEIYTIVVGILGLAKDIRSMTL
jgi:trk system potassium uptake protein TrkH